MKRVNGYYWVRAVVITPHNKEWQVAEYIDGSWFVEGEDCCMPDEVFHEINETRILSPDEQVKS